MPSKRAIIADAVRHNNKVRKEWASAQGLASKNARFRDLVAYVSSSNHTHSHSASNATIRSKNKLKDDSILHEEGVLIAIGVGIGGQVRIPRFRLTGIVDAPVAQGQVVKVCVKKIDIDTGRIYMELY